ncbi:hypothetical protein C8R47DRAFT_1316337 [Mycena vitilis]|nr:hypothetical protein C8R47DRAFT_1316337 [Mycena vitilis]
MCAGGFDLFRRRILLSYTVHTTLPVWVLGFQHPRRHLWPHVFQRKRCSHPASPSMQQPGAQLDAGAIQSQDPHTGGPFARRFLDSATRRRAAIQSQDPHTGVPFARRFLDSATRRRAATQSQDPHTGVPFARRFLDSSTRRRRHPVAGSPHWRALCTPVLGFSNSTPRRHPVAGSPHRRAFCTPVQPLGFSNSTPAPWPFARRFGHPTTRARGSSVTRSRHRCADSSQATSGLASLTIDRSTLRASITILPWDGRSQHTRRSSLLAEPPLSTEPSPPRILCGGHRPRPLSRWLTASMAPSFGTGLSWRRHAGIVDGVRCRCCTVQSRLNLYLFHNSFLARRLYKKFYKIL